MATRFYFRSHNRFQVQCPVYFLGGSFLGRGTAIDVSQDGWRVEGDHQVKRGMHLAVRLFLPDQDPPVRVERATVRWCSDQEFGLQILKMDPPEQQRLSHFVKSLVQRSYAWRS